MSVDTQKIIEIVKQVKPLFLDREGSSQIKVKGVADFVTRHRSILKCRSR